MWANGVIVVGCLGLPAVIWVIEEAFQAAGLVGVSSLIGRSSALFLFIWVLSSLSTSEHGRLKFVATIRQVAVTAACTYAGIRTDHIGELAVLAASAIAVAAYVEEVAFRVVLPRLLRPIQPLRIFLPIALAQAIFAVAHLPTYSGARPLLYLAHLFVAGLALSAIVQRLGVSFAATFHALSNVAVVTGSDAAVPLRHGLLLMGAALFPFSVLMSQLLGRCESQAK